MMWAPRGLKDGSAETCMSTFKLLCLRFSVQCWLYQVCAHRTQILARVQGLACGPKGFGTRKGPPTLQWKLLAFSGVNVPFGPDAGSHVACVFHCGSWFGPHCLFLRKFHLPLRSLLLVWKQGKSVHAERASQSSLVITGSQPSHPL